MPRTLSGQDSAKRHPLNMRTTETIRRQLEEAAAKSGRSLAQEVEHRLERSFEIDQAWTPQTNSLIIRLMVSALRVVEITKGEMWSQSATTAAACKAALIGVLDAVIVTDSRTSSEPIALGREIAASEFHGELVRIFDARSHGEEPIANETIRERIEAQAKARGA